MSDVVRAGASGTTLIGGVPDGTIKGSAPPFTASDLGSFTVSNSPAPGTAIFSKPIDFTKDNYKQCNF